VHNKETLQNNFNYTLSPEQLGVLEGALVDDVLEIGSGRDVYCVWLNSNSPYADIVRTHESAYWNNASEIFKKNEENSKFMLVVDTRHPGKEGIKRASRITFAQSDFIEKRKTGMAIVDDVIDSGQGLSFDDFIDYYSGKGVDIKTCFSVETNIKVEKAERYKGLPLAEIGYLAIFKKIEQTRKGNLAYIFAAINQDSINSFNLIDLRAEPLAGRTDLRTPDGAGCFYDDFQTVALPTTKHNLEIFTGIKGLSSSEIYLQ